MDTATYGINQFTDMSQQEFKTKILMPSQPAPQHSDSKKIRPQKQVDLPESFDWRDHQAVTSVKDQGSIGSCWAFSAIGNVEGQHSLANNELIDLSVEQIVECDATRDPNSNKADCGVFGGWPFLAMEYIINSKGVASEKNYPYCVGTTCYPCEAEGMDEERCGRSYHIPACKVENPCKKDVLKTAQIDDWKSLSNDEVELAQQLIEIGPISVGLDATMLQFYHSGVFDPILGCSTDLNHGVLMIGFGKTKWFSEDYWIIKNSWGERFGEKGYFRIRRGKGTCGINTDPITAVINKKQFLQ